MDIILSDRADILTNIILKYTDHNIGVLIVQDEKRKTK